MEKLSELKGLGPKSERCLNEIGIYSKEDLEKKGAVRAFLALKEKSCIDPSLNFLYAMVGALENKHWTEIAKTEKGRLLMEIEGYQELEKIFSEKTHDNTSCPSKRGGSEFEKIPGVGKKLSKTFVDLGYKKVNDLKGADPEVMYQNLIKLRGHSIDRCVLYVFRCAVYYANNTIHEPELLKWWSWKDKD